jgi:hypothetical protein
MPERDASLLTIGATALGIIKQADFIAGKMLII